MSSGITRRKGKSRRANVVECAICASAQEKGSPITAFPAQNTGSTFETGGHRMKNEIRIELPEKCGCGSENLNIWGTRIERRVKVDVRCMRCGKILYEEK